MLDRGSLSRQVVYTSLLALLLVREGTFLRYMESHGRILKAVHRCGRSDLGCVKGSGYQAFPIRRVLWIYALGQIFTYSGFLSFIKNTFLSDQSPIFFSESSKSKFKRILVRVNFISAQASLRVLCQPSGNNSSRWSLTASQYSYEAQREKART